jgi:lysophospholipase L1-like esterase
LDQSGAEEWVRYTHLDKTYGYLPGMRAALPGILGLDPDEFARVRAGFDALVAEAAAELRGGLALDRLPFEDGQTVLAVGDSLTDDLLSWAEILRHLVGGRVNVVNGGLSGHTSAMVLRRWPPTLDALRPDWVLCLLGTNDVTRVGPDASKPQVSLDETVANLAELRRIAAAKGVGRWVWLTPPPFVEERAAADPGSIMGESVWRNDDVLALTIEMRRFEDPVVDLCEVFGLPPDPVLQGPDGIHPSLDGQAAIAAALVERLSGGSS